MASASLSRESFNDAVEKALEAIKDSSIEYLTKYHIQSFVSCIEWRRYIRQFTNGSWEIVDISTSSIQLHRSPSYSSFPR